MRDVKKMIQKKVITRVNKHNPLPLESKEDDVNVVTNEDISELKILQNLTASFKRRRPAPIPREPVISTPRVEKRFRSMAETINTCPYELQEIFYADLDLDNPIVADALSKFVMAVKLTHTDLFEDVHRDLAAHNERNRQVQEKYEKDMAEAKHLNDVRVSNIQLANGNFYKKWNSVVDSLEARLKVDNTIEGQSSDDIWFLNALSTYDCVKMNKDDTITLDADRCRSLEDNVIVDLKIIALNMKEEYRINSLTDWAYTADLDKLFYEVHNSSTTNHAVFEVLATVYAHRTNKNIWYDGYGDIDWDRTFLNDSDE